MLKRFYLAAILGWLFLLQACGQSNGSAYNLMLKSIYKNSVPQITTDRLNQNLQDNAPIVLLDTRTPAEFEISHIKGATLVNYENFDPESLNGVSKSAQIVVYCSVGYRSERVGEKLLSAGYTNVRNLYGGIFQWVNEDLPVFNDKGQTQQVHAYSKSWGVWLQKGKKIYGNE